MMKRYMIAGLLIGLLAVFGLFSIVSAQGANPPVTPTPGWGYGMGMMGGAAGQGPMHEYMQKALAEKLGMSESELEQAYAKGQTFWQIAQAKGFTTEQASQMMVDARNAALDKMVADGTITKEQADWMKTRMTGTGMRGNGMMGGRGFGGCMGGYNGGQSTGGQSTDGTSTTPRRGMMGRSW